MKRLVSLLFVALLAAAPAAYAQAPSVTLVGEDGVSKVIPLKDIATLPQLSAAISHEGKTYGFKGPLLSDVLKAVNAPLGKDMRGPALSDVVIVTAADGYVVALALSDLEPSVRATKVLLATAMADGAPLAKDGPFRLVVDGDLKPARSERNVVKIELRRLSSAPSSMAH
jgi:hypothetical protein